MLAKQPHALMSYAMEQEFIWSLFWGKALSRGKGKLSPDHFYTPVPFKLQTKLGKGEGYVLQLFLQSQHGLAKPNADNRNVKNKHSILSSKITFHSYQKIWNRIVVLRHWNSKTIGSIPFLWTICTKLCLRQYSDAAGRGCTFPRCSGFPPTSQRHAGI